MRFKLLPVCAVMLFLVARPAQSVELKISAKALEHTLQTQLFAMDTGRYYLRGDVRSACRVYAEKPSVTFSADRVVVHLHTSARLGTPVRGACLGLALAPDVDGSLIPVAEGETIGFRDARLEHVSDSRELNFLLTPFLSHKVPSSMKLNAADIVRQLLSQSTQTTGYLLKLDRLQVHSMQVRDSALIIDVDGDLSVD
jgi:hypothetical protein